MSHYDKIQKSNEFIKIDVITREKWVGEGDDRHKEPVVVGTIIPMHHIKAISHIVREESIIANVDSDAPEEGKCALELITGNTAIVPYSLEQLAMVLQAVDANTILEAVVEKELSRVN